MKIKKVLVADRMHDSIVPLLEEIGISATYAPAISRQEILLQLSEYEGLIIRSKTPVDRQLIDAGINLKFIARAGAGIDAVDVEYLLAKEIELINAPEGNRDAVGEHALGMLLSLLHRINHSYHNVKNFNWDREGGRGLELKGRTVGIYGVGNMGSSFGRKLTGMDCDVIGYDKFHQAFEEESIQPVELKEFFERTEILSIHVPLTEITRGLFDLTYLQRFKRLKVLLNTSRGEVVKTSAVVQLLEDKSLIGVGLDVLENEKIAIYSESEKEELEKLMTHENVLITPHVAGWTIESYARINQVLVAKIGKLQS